MYIKIVKKPKQTIISVKKNKKIDINHINIYLEKIGISYYFHIYKQNKTNHTYIIDTSLSFQVIKKIYEIAYSSAGLNYELEKIRIARRREMRKKNKHENLKIINIVKGNLITDNNTLCYE